VAQNRIDSDQTPLEQNIPSESKVTQNRAGVAQNSQGDTHNHPRDEQNKTANPHIFGHYNNSNTNKSFNDLNNISLIPPLPDNDDLDLSTDHIVVGVGEIDLNKLLGFGSYKHNEKK